MLCGPENINEGYRVRGRKEAKEKERKGSGEKEKDQIEIFLQLNIHSCLKSFPEPSLRQRFMAK
jgi:hypothetical protein